MKYAAFLVSCVALAALTASPSLAQILGNPGGGPGGGTNILLGVVLWNNPDPDPFHVIAGRYPDFTGNDGSMGPGGGSTLNGYPVDVAFMTVTDSDGKGGCAGWDTSLAAAANGAYNNNYQAVINYNIGSKANTVYYIRIDREWNGNWFCDSPWFGQWDESRPSVTPAVWIQGFQNLVNIIRSNPSLSNVKIEWDGPNNDTEAQYYPGDAFVDLIGFDSYPTSVNTGATSQQAWQNMLYGCDKWACPGRPFTSQNLTYMSNFAKAHNKPMVVSEWADTFGDGYMITQFANWFAANNVVAQAYWDSASSCQNVRCTLEQTAATRNAYIAAFGGTQYTGGYFTLRSLPNNYTFNLF